MQIPNRGDYRFFDNVGRSQELVRLRNENAALLSGAKYETSNFPHGKVTKRRLVSRDY